MGAEFVCGSFSRDVSDNPIKTIEGFIEQAKYDHGHAGYSGTLAEANGVQVVLGKTFDDFNEAYDWLDENCQKWGPVLVVRIGNDYVYGAWCSS